MVKAVEGNLTFYSLPNIYDKVVCKSKYIPKNFIRSIIDLQESKFLYTAPLDFIIVMDFEATC